MRRELGKPIHQRLHYELPPVLCHPVDLKGPSPEPRRSTLDPDRGDYGEAPARVRCGWGPTASWRQNVAMVGSYLKIGDCLKPGPAMTFVFVHERVDSINDGEFVVSMLGYPNQPSQWRLVDYPASQHDGACGFSFVDGHSEMKRWLDRRTIPPIGPVLMLNVPVPNSPDAYWLMDHCTRKP
jgi:prepilin-type processing-associated H-X9-DG protein